MYVSWELRRIKWMVFGKQWVPRCRGWMATTWHGRYKTRVLDGRHGVPIRMPRHASPQSFRVSFTIKLIISRLRHPLHPPTLHQWNPSLHACLRVYSLDLELCSWIFGGMWEEGSLQGSKEARSNFGIPMVALLAYIAKESPKWYFLLSEPLR